MSDPNQAQSITYALELLDRVSEDGKLLALRNLAMNNGGRWDLPSAAPGFPSYNPLVKTIEVFGVFAMADEVDELPKNWILAATTQLEGLGSPELQPVPRCSVISGGLPHPEEETNKPPRDFSEQWVPEIGEAVMFKQTSTHEFEEGTVSATFFAPLAVEVVDMRARRLKVSPSNLKPIEARTPTSHGALDSPAASPPPEAAGSNITCPFCAPEIDRQLTEFEHYKADGSIQSYGLSCSRCGFEMAAPDKSMIISANTTLWDYLDAAKPSVALGA